MLPEIEEQSNHFNFKGNRWTTSSLGWTGKSNHMHLYTFLAGDGDSPRFVLKADVDPSMYTLYTLPEIVYLDEQDL